MKHDETELEALGAEIAREQDAWLNAQPAGPLRATRKHARTRRRVAWTVAAGATLLAIVGWAGLRLLRPGPLTLYVAERQHTPNHFLSAPDGAPLPLRFSDGSRLQLAPKSRARVVELTERGAHVLLETGSAEVSVVPKRGAQWKISAGPYLVEVTGTRFRVAWDGRDQALLLAMYEGKVVVSGCALGEARALLAGETLRASCRGRDFEIRRGNLRSTAGEAVHGAAARALDDSSPQRAVLRPVRPAESTPRTRPMSETQRSEATARPAQTTTAPTWQTLARAGRFQEARALVLADKLIERLAQVPVDELILLGDVGRLSGDLELALRAYSRARAAAPQTQTAASAAFAIGTIAFDRKHDYTAAARWFGLSLEEQAHGPLAREALGRQVESLARSQDQVRAAARAKLYLERYPDGPHAQLARALVR